MLKSDRLSILYIAYPLLKVSEDSAGGAEQMLLTVEREMSAADHFTTVAACDGSQVNGRLLATGPPASRPDQFERREREATARILDYLQRNPHEFDLIHDKSGVFFRHAGRCPVPVLATLHLARSLYREEWFCSIPFNLYFNCVSESQARSFEGLPNLLGVVQNGIAIEEFPFTPSKEDYLLWLGRICEEKAPHLAIAAARQAGLPLVLAGQVYPFRYHEEYFAHAIEPRVREGSSTWFIDSPSLAQKIDLLSDARALLLTSTVEESSSLVAMEAMACGTPVVAFRRGAFPEVVAEGETGFLVDTVEQMAAALAHVSEISPAACRQRVQQRFTASRMAREYEGLYRNILAATSEQAAA